MVGTGYASSANSDYDQVTELSASSQLVSTSTSDPAQYECDDKDADPLKRVESLQIKFLRLVRRIGESPENNVVAQVLYRLHLASLIRATDSEIKRTCLKINKARAIAAEQEATNRPPLDFSIKILLLGKTGVGKSATINAIFDQEKVITDPFQPSTDKIQEVSGNIKGINVTVIDTPGLSPPHGNQRRNRKIMQEIRSFIRKSPPDVVLYFERLDLTGRNYNEYPLFKLITEVFGSSIWFSTVLVMTHASSPLPEGADGYPVNYEALVHYWTNMIQHYIHQAVSSTQLDNPVILVENHPMCKTNNKGEKVLRSGQAWISRFLLLCTATKVLGEANSLLKFQDSFQLTPASNRVPSMPHLLSSLLRPHSLANSGGMESEMDDLSDNDEDEYDQLPPIRILTKTQFQKLSENQKKSYLDELDYRETLFLKKQWKEEVRKQKMAMVQDNNDTSNDSEDYENPSEEAMQVLDIAIAQSFDSENPAYRYRCLVGNDQWLSRPVLDPQGWDHDVGFDGINIEFSRDVKRRTYISLAGQMRKDKEDFTIQSECAANYMDPSGHSLHSGLDIQTAGKELVSTLRSDARFRNLSFNTMGAGLSVTKFGDMYFFGAKVEDSISLGKRFKLTMNTGRMGGGGQVAYGGSLEATIKGKDYPVRDEKVILAGTILSFEKEMVLGGSFQSDFRVGRGSKVSISGNLNSRRLGQVSVRTNTSEHVQIALIAVVSLVQAFFRKKPMDTAD